MLRHLILVSFLVVAAVSLSAQVPSALPPPNASAHFRHEQIPLTPEEIQHQKDMQKELEKAQAKQRYQELRRDTDRLLDLATQLKQDVDAAGQQKLSLAVIKKADEIEKLAKSVKTKMKGD